MDTAATTKARQRPKALPSQTVKLRTERGSLYLVITYDSDGDPFEVFGHLGKAGSLERGMLELACRLISLHLRRNTPLEEIIDQCSGIQEMQEQPNVLPNGKVTTIKGLGDAIAQILAICKELNSISENSQEE